MMRLVKLAALAGIAAAAGLTLGAAQRPVALLSASPGLWEVSGVPSARGPLRECLADLAVLAQLEHRGQKCNRFVVHDNSTSTVIHYSCTGGGFGQTKMTVITPRSLRIETQGISNNLPFNYVIQAHRIGDCPARQSAAAH